MLLLIPTTPTFSSSTAAAGRSRMPWRATFVRWVSEWVCEWVRAGGSVCWPSKWPKLLLDPLSQPSCPFPLHFYLSSYLSTSPSTAYPSTCSPTYVPSNLSTYRFLPLKCLKHPWSSQHRRSRLTTSPTLVSLACPQKNSQRLMKVGGPPWSYSYILTPWV